ncbi:hypothetical protein C1646_712623 [Rhizophagus diaphanus]|nr:hypothetical protein C1646_712623 [Rhizophagus diaphanus] [Rhizophagus sp. MUCL 43196]
MQYCNITNFTIKYILYMNIKRIGISNLLNFEYNDFFFSVKPESPLYLVNNHHCI